MFGNITLGELQEMIESLVMEHGEEVLDKIVFSSSDYGDHCHTTQINNFDSLELHVPVKSGYSDSGYKIDEKTDATIDQDDAVVVLV